MSYNKRTWATGNVVGAVDLNRIENGIADIDVDEIRGWGVSSTQLFSESVTTAVVQEEPAPVGTLTYSTQITSATLPIAFNGETYNLPLTVLEWGNLYGEMGESGPVFTTYPVCILSTESSNLVYTETAGTYTVSAYLSSVEVSDHFATAVQIANVFTITDTNGTLDKTFAEIRDEFIAGKTCIILRSNEYCLVYEVEIGTLYIYIRNNYYTASSEDAYPVYH